MTTSDTNSRGVPLPPMPWYQSKVIVGALVSLVATLLVSFGLIEGLGAAQQEALVSAIVIGAGAVGSLVSIIARLRQKKAPPISLGNGGGPLALVALLAAGTLPLAGCLTVPAAPAVIADRTGADERGGIAIESLYALAARAGALAFRSGLVPLAEQPETRRSDFCDLVEAGTFEPADRGAELMAIECRLRALRDAGRAAYDAGNAGSYQALLAEATRLSDRLTALIS